MAGRLDRDPSGRAGTGRPPGGCLTGPGHPSSAGTPKPQRGQRRSTTGARGERSRRRPQKPPQAPCTPAAKKTQVFTSIVLPHSVPPRCLLPGAQEGQIWDGAGASTGLPSPQRRPTPRALWFSPGDSGIHVTALGDQSWECGQLERGVKGPGKPQQNVPGVCTGGSWDRTALYGLWRK